MPLIVPSRGLSRCSALRRRLSLCSRGSALLSVGVQNEPLATLTWCSLLWSLPWHHSVGPLRPPPSHLSSLCSTSLPFLLRRRGAIAATPFAIVVGRAPARRPRDGPSLGLALQGGPGPPIHGAGFAAGRSATELSQFIVVASLYVHPSPPSRPPSPPRSAAALYFTGPPQIP